LRGVIVEPLNLALFVAALDELGWTPRVPNYDDVLRHHAH